MLTFTGFISSISGYSEEVNQIDTIVTDVCESQDNVIVTCHTFGFPGEPHQEISMPPREADFLYNKIKVLQMEIACNPLSDKIQQLQHEIIIFADEHNLLPVGLSQDTLQSCLYPSRILQNHRLKSLPFLQSKGSEFLCTFVSTGSGAALPVIALPRFIPIIMVPIPRMVMWWRAQEAVTSCGGLRSGTGFIAYGQQDGIALGFWGIGFTFSLPPLMGMYGLMGYALFARVNAADIEFYPPNNPPVISSENPPSGTQNIPVSLSELSFRIEDSDEDLMSYSVTTEPYIGGDSGNNKGNGFYSVSVSDLEPEVIYKWTVMVSDGKDTVEKQFTFTTEAVAPVVSNPSPPHGARHIPVDLSQLSFTLKDFQGDPMDYTVETSPDIGSDSITGAGDGTYTVDVSGLDYSTVYTWYVNVTDGAHWTREIFSFQTELKMVFDPFDEGWQYRKNITIDHTKVSGDFTDFPVLVSTIDSDLRDKAQYDGDDILFMDGPGVANRLYHEIEKYVGSSGELVAWVNVPILSSTVDTVLYIYYGDPGCSSQQSPDMVWDSNYVMVHHMNGADWTSIDDSTSYDNDVISSGGTPDYQQTGTIGHCVNFDGVNERLNIADSSSLDVSSGLTLEVWCTHDVTANEFPVAKRENPGPAAYDFSTFTHHMRFNVWQGDTVGGYVVSNTTIPSGWSYWAGTYDGAYVKIYFNGISDATPDPTTANIDTTDDAVTIGWGYSDTYAWDGLIDEVRISKTARSIEWISTQYNNQDDPSSFLSFGPEETGP